MHIFRYLSPYLSPSANGCAEKLLSMRFLAYRSHSIPVSRSFIFLYIRGYPDEISSFFIFEHIYARRFDLVVCRLDRCISVASTRRHALSCALDESLFESASGVFSSFFIYLLQTENLLLIKIGVNS